MGRDIWFGMALLAAVGMAPAVSSAPSRAETLADAPRTPIVVELFTSEGCSSCPPADAFLAQLEALQPVEGAEVIAIEEHVDYWDQLGWRDPYSSADWTERQRKYAGVLGTSNIYTPQMVVNGAVEFVGSREQSGKRAIDQATQRKAIPLAVTAVATPGKRSAEVTVRIAEPTVEGSSGEWEVWLAITETGLRSAVTRGENAGKDLRHASVLRKLQRLGSVTLKNGQATSALVAKVAVDSSWKRENLHAVAFIQERRHLHILGASQISLNL
jgi:hypothetical protein